MLSLRVVMPSSRTKTMRFTGNMSVSEACKEIREKTEEGGADHALFLPPNELKARKGQWLRPDRTFYFYDIVSGEELHYRKQHRRMKVSLMDGTEKIVIVNEADPVMEVSKQIAEKLRIAKPYEEWSLTLGSTRKWLDPVLGLQEQGVTEQTRVWFKKKQFWSDDKIDKSEPYTLTLMYYQAKFGITHGEHNLTNDEASMFAAIALQAKHGDYDPKRHNPKEVLVVDEYFNDKFKKAKKVHKRAIEEWKKLAGMTELDSYYQFMKLARTLATYGQTQFVVGEVVKGKRDKKPAIVAVSKSAISRLDYKTRSVLERWPYHQIKRWAATASMFTLDFGDLRDTYYNVYTNDGRDIVGIISGYVDIMIRLRKDAGDVTEVDEGTAAVIEDIAPNEGVVFEYNTTVITMGDSGDEDWDSGEVLGSSEEDDPDPERLPKPMLRGGGNKLYVNDLATAVNAVKKLQDTLDSPYRHNPHDEAPPTDDLRSPQKFIDLVSDMPRLLDDPEQNAGAICENLAQLIKAARKDASLTDDISLLEAARRVTEEVEDLLKTAHDLEDDPESVPLKTKLLKARSAVKGANAYALGVVDGAVADQTSEQLLLATAEKLGDSVKTLAATAERAAQSAEAANKLEEVSAKAMSLGEAIPSKVETLAPIASQPASADELKSVARKANAVARKMFEMVEAAEVPPAVMSKVQKAVRQVQASAAQMMDSTNMVRSRAQQATEDLQSQMRKVSDNVEALMDSVGDKKKLENVNGALTDDLASLIAAAKQMARGTEEDFNLLEAAKKVSKEVEDLLSTTRDVMDDPKNLQLTRRMLKSAQAIAGSVAKQLEDTNTEALPYADVRKAAKETVTTATELARIAREVLPEIERSKAKELYPVLTEAEMACTKMVKALSVAQSKADDKAIQEKLVAAVKGHTKTLQTLTAVTQTCLPAIESTAVKHDLNKATASTAEQLRTLVSALKAIPDETSKAFKSIEQDLEREAVKADSAILNAAVSNLQQEKPRAQAVEELGDAVQHLQDAMSEMATSKQIVPAAEEMVAAFHDVVEASQAVAAATADPVEQQSVLRRAKNMLPDITSLIEAAKSSAQGVAQADEVSLLGAAKAVNRALRGLMGTEYQERIRDANKAFLPDLSALLKAAKAASSANNDEADINLLKAAQKVSSNLKELMTTLRPEDLPPGMLSNIDKLLKTADKKNDPSTAQKMEESTKKIAESAQLMLEETKVEEGPPECDEAAEDVAAALQDLAEAPHNDGDAAPAPYEEMVAAAEMVTTAAQNVQSVVSPIAKTARSVPDDLVPLVTQLAPATVRLVEAANQLVEVCTTPESAEAVLESTEALGRSMAVLASNARTAKQDPASEARMVQAEREIVEEAKRLIALADAATPGLQQVEEAAKLLAQTAEFGSVKPEAAEPSGLPGLIDACRALQDEVGSLAEAQPTDFGEAAVETAHAANDVVAAAQNYNDITQALATVEQCRALAQKIRHAGNPKEALAHAREINSLAPRVMAVMKRFATAERDVAVKEEITSAARVIKPALKQLGINAKAANQPGGIPKTADAAFEVVTALEELATSSPDTAKAVGLIEGAKAVAGITRNAVQSAGIVAKRPTDNFAKAQLLLAAEDVGEGCDDLINSAKLLAAGRAELEDAKQAVQKQVGEMEAASIAAEIGLLNVNTVKSRQVAQEALMDTTEELKESVAEMVEAAKRKDMRTFGAKSKPMLATVQETAQAAKELAGTTSNADFQVQSLERAKTTGVAALAFLSSALDLSGDSSNKQAQMSLLKAAKAVSANVEGLLDALKTSAEDLAKCDEAADEILEHSKRLNRPAGKDQAMAYGQAQLDLVAEARAFGKGVQLVQRNAKNNAVEIGDSCLALADLAAALVNASTVCVASVDDASLKRSLAGDAKKACEAASHIVLVAKEVVQDASSDNLADLSAAFKQCTATLGRLVQSVRDAAVGEKECREAAVAISKVQADLDAASIFAETGQLDYTSDESLAQLNADFEEATEELLEDARTLKEVAGGEEQAELGNAALAMAASMKELAERSKGIAAAIGDFVEFDEQRTVLSNTKEVAVRAQAMVMAAKAGMAAGAGSDASQVHVVYGKLKSTVSALLKSVKGAAGAAIVTQKAISSCVARVLEATEGFDSLKAQKADAQKVVEALRGVGQASSRLVSASNSNSAKELVAALENTESNVLGMMRQALGASRLSDDDDVQANIAEAVQDVGFAIVDLLKMLQSRGKDDWEVAEEIAGFSDVVADRIAEVVSALKGLPGQAKLDLEEDSLGEEVIDTLTVATKALVQSTGDIRLPKGMESVEQGMEQGSIAAILIKAGSAIISSTTSVMKAATQTQQELLQRGKANPRLNVFRKDKEWATALMDTADDVVKANSFFVSIINRCAAADVKNIASAIEELIKAARIVGNGTQKLVASSKAKSDQRSLAMKKLTKSGKAVSDATKALLEAAKHAAEMAKQQEALADKEPYDFAKRTEEGELKAQLEIARIERALEAARAAAKVKSQLADEANWQEAKKGGVSKIDKLMAKRRSINKKQARNRGESLAVKLAKREKASEARGPAAGKQKKALAPPPLEYSEEEEDLGRAEYVSSEEEDSDDAAAAAAFLAAKKKKAAGRGKSSGGAGRGRGGRKLK